MMRTKLTNIFGWYGVLAILAAYMLVSFAVIKSNSLVYQALNFTGALGLLIETTQKRDVQPAVLNIVWLLIAVGSIIKLLI
jgi:glucan phosphoethanolaminetransferase (alkaline phosphatase superfamily)